MGEFIKAVLFGIVEGITEWLPISSTGHMILLDEFVKLQVSPEFYKVFEVVIQLGAIFAVILLFWGKLWPFGKKSNSSPLYASGWGAWIKTDIFVMWFKILVCCIPAAVIGLAFDDLFDALFYNYTCVAIALIVWGIAFIIVERSRKRKAPVKTAITDITYRDALIIGVFQLCAAVFPGTSRSGATIVGALLIGISRTIAAEFTFYMAVPVMLGASLLKVLKYGFSYTGTEITILLTGMAVAFAVSILVIRFLLGYIRKHDFQVFGWYRILLGAIVLAYGFLK